ncbi:MAG: alpha-galactosidase [Caldiserica bacterium]|nr:alpha-galactosidase [Caldisericota bacterium]
MEDVRGRLTYRREGVVVTLNFDLNGEAENDDLVIAPTIGAIAPGERWTVTVTPRTTVTLLAAELRVPVSVPPTSRIFVNGYQTWTESRELGPRDRIPSLNRLARSRCSMYGDYEYVTNPGFPGRFHGWTYGYVRTTSNLLTLFGSLAEHTGFTLVTVASSAGRVTLQKECGGLVPTEPYVLYDVYVGTGTDRETFGRYFDLLGLRRLRTPPLTGWTSWYNYYTGITQEIIRHNLDALSEHEVPLDVFQIDDGWQHAVGDWLTTNAKFPDGMGTMADAIHERGCKAGLWLAPFIAEETSDLLRDHPDWFLTEDHRKPIKAGYNPGWSGFFYSLDVANPAVRSYLGDVFNLVLHTWHFDLVKLDFLYAACRKAPEGKTRGQVMSESMQFLRDIIGDTLILGCGVPLGPAFGQVDFCRISGDVALKWEDRLLSTIHYRERVSTVCALRNTISRRHLNGNAFWNDPDVCILRDTRNSLTEAQRRTLFLVNQAMGGLVFTSDDISSYTDAQLRQYLSQFPFSAKAALEARPFGEAWRLTLRAENATYVVAANLGSRPATIDLDPGVYYCNGHLIDGREPLQLLPFDSTCLRKAHGDNVELLGTTTHLFPGLDVARFECHETSIAFQRFNTAQLEGEALIGVPDASDRWTVNGVAVIPERQAVHTVLRVPIARVARPVDSGILLTAAAPDKEV